MSFYQQFTSIGSKFIGPHILLKFGFNWSPMYRRSTVRITHISKDLMTVNVKLPISYKNKNYVGSIFGGSLFSAVDPVPMVQLINLVGDDYVVWGKSAQVLFKRPAREHLYAEFKFTQTDLDEFRQRIADEREIEVIKSTKLTGKDGSVVYCQVDKTIYMADKAYCKEKRRRKQQSKG